MLVGRAAELKRPKQRTKWYTAEGRKLRSKERVREGSKRGKVKRQQRSMDGNLGVEE